MKLSVSILIVLLATQASAGPPCIEFDGTVQDHLDAELVPGHYELTIVATHGSKEGSRAGGVVRLLPALDDDRSPTTGEPAHDISSPFEAPLYGWTDANLKAVGAPMCSDELHPAPESMDPIYPGVRVFRLTDEDRVFEWMLKYPENASILAIGTLSNLRNGEKWLDGCGIGLIVQAQIDGTFVGDWREWGVVRDGRGHFCLTQTSVKPSN